MSISVRVFDVLPDGTEIPACTMTRGDTSVTLMAYGARIADLKYRGQRCVIGFPKVADYRGDGGYHGATVGRYANRIADGVFSLNGKEYRLAKNEKGVAHLHGGTVGFSDRVWDMEQPVSGPDCDRVTFSLFSPDGEEGFPGSMTVRVTFTLDDDNTVKIDYNAVSDKATIVAMTNHSYFCISGPGKSIHGQELTVNADRFAAVGEHLIPVGLRDVEGTPFDFRTPKLIGRDIGEKDEQLAIAGGYDHCWLLNPTDGPCAVLRSPETGICVEVFTTEKGIQIYAGNFLNGSAPFFGEVPQAPRTAIAMECAALPDSPNRPDFPSVAVRAGETYHQTTAYRFSLRK